MFIRNINNQINAPRPNNDINTLNVALITFITTKNAITPTRTNPAIINIEVIYPPLYF